MIKARPRQFRTQRAIEFELHVQDVLSNKEANIYEQYRQVKKNYEPAASYRLGEVSLSYLPGKQRQLVFQEGVSENEPAVDNSHRQLLCSDAITQSQRVVFNILRRPNVNEIISMFASLKPGRSNSILKSSSEIEYEQYNEEQQKHSNLLLKWKIEYELDKVPLLQNKLLTEKPQNNPNNLSKFYVLSAHQMHSSQPK